MSITVENLSKTYGSQKAVDSISFTANVKSITGFLGPNGAGKSTTMKMLTGFLTPTSGSVTVAGFNGLNEPLKVSKEVGYLPEHNPLYLDMYVKEALGFVGAIHGIEQPENRIKAVIEMTGLGDEQHKKVGALSKGYRQRVGLAQAILHDPKVLILDEPTSGLDPNQLIGIRALIKELGKEKTILFSTHIMQEVEAVCERIIIINKGKIVADDNLSALQDSARGGSLEQTFIRLTSGQ